MKQSTPSPNAVRKSYDRYTIEVVNRRELTDAPYNPRVMSDAARRKLKKDLERHGLVQPPVWNRRTGHIVGGHQRISQLDAINGSPDYDIQVAVLDVSESDEKELNLLLNNPNAQGDWDLAKLEEIIGDTTINLDGTGFDMGDIYRLIGDIPGSATADDFMLMAEQVRDARDRYEQAARKLGAKNQESEFYVVLVFPNAAETAIFLTTLGLDDNRYQDGRKIMSMLHSQNERSE